MSAGSGQSGGEGLGTGDEGVELASQSSAVEPSPLAPDGSSLSDRPGLIESMIKATQPGPSEVSDRTELRPSLDQFLKEPRVGNALAQWTGWKLEARSLPSRQEIAGRLGRDIARLDAMLTEQVNAIIHHPKFQKLEASWQGLHYLVGQLEGTENVKIRVLNVGWKELARDVERAMEFDQSQLFTKIYSEEYGMPGGEPFSVLLGDYEIRPLPCEEHPVDDIAALTAISQVAAAAFAPFIAAVHPSMFGLARFSGLEQPLNLPRSFEQLDYLKWRAFRDTEDSRFVGLTLPRVLMRLPYEDDDSRVDGFRFSEDTAGPDRSKYLWGNAAYAFGAVLIRSFAASGWLADIRGAPAIGGASKCPTEWPDVEAGGLVCDLPIHCFSTDKRGVATKCSTDVIITDRQEPVLSNLGFVPLCHCKDTGFSAFYASQSTQKPKRYDSLSATMNARISAMLQYILCTSRFAHYLKVAARDKIGAFSEPEECEQYLYSWLQNYVTSDPEASPEVKARFPLREAKVRVREHPEKPGCYLCVAHLWPHFELDDLIAAVKVTTELVSGKVG